MRHSPGRPISSDVVRRLKRHILTEDGKPRFLERAVEPCPVRARPGEHDRFIELHGSHHARHADGRSQDLRPAVPNF